MIEAVHGSRPFADGSLLEQFAAFNFLYYSGVLMLISVAIIVAVSLSAPAQDPGTIRGLTYSALTSADRVEIRASWNRWDVLGTMVVLGMVAGVYLYFSFWLG
jgi:SSS family solute:Na+ symporter